MTYILAPGKVTSKTDGEVHYITAHELARLYGVDYRECRVLYPGEGSVTRGFKLQPGDILLYPRKDGNYSLPDRVIT